MTEQNFCMRAYIGNIAYPVGSIYICGTTHDNGANYDPDVDSPWALFGGTEDDWEQLEDTMLMASGSNHVLWNRHNNSEKIVLTEGQLPTHTHTIDKTITETDGTVPPSEKSLKGKVWFAESEDETEMIFKSDGVFTNGRSSDFKEKYLDQSSNSGDCVLLTFDGTHSHSINTTGNSEEIDIAPTYTVVHMWRRKHLAEVVNVDYDWPRIRK